MNKPIFITLLILTILMPLFFLPFNTDQINFPKTVLFISLTVLALMFWLINILRSKKIKIKRTILDFPIIALTAVHLISSIFSVDKYASFSKFFVILFLGIFYFLVVQIINKKRKKILLTGLVISLLIAGLFFILNTKYQILNTINPLGTQYSLVALLAIMAPIVYKWKKMMIVPVIIILAILYIINFQISWIVLGIGTLAYLVFCAVKNKQTKWSVVPLAILLICILSVVVDMPRANMQSFISLPAEVSLSKQLSWDIAFKNSTQNIKQALIGSGPGTFGYAFSKYRPEQFNQNMLWKIRFQKGNNFWLENLATIGWIGILAWLSIFGFIFVFGRKKYILLLPILIASFFTNFSIVLLFVLFLFFALTTRRGVLLKKQIKTQGIGLGFVLALAGMIIFSVFLGRIYAADYYFARALARGSTSAQNSNMFIQKAIQLNKYNPGYRIAFAQNAIEQLQGVQDQEKAEILIARAVNSSKKAIDMSPKNASFWQARAQIFVNLQQAEWAIKSWEKALELEPTNPILYQELGRLKQDSQLLKKAVDLKPNLSVSQYELGRIYYNQGEMDKAESHFVNAIKINQNYSNALYSLGLIYQSQNKKQEALILFKKVLELNPGNEEVGKKIQGLSGD